MPCTVGLVEIVGGMVIGMGYNGMDCVFVGRTVVYSVGTGCAGSYTGFGAIVLVEWAVGRSSVDWSIPVGVGPEWAGVVEVKD